jgi:hypothetical protein
MIRLGTSGWELYPGPKCEDCQPYPGLRDRLSARMFIQQFTREPLADAAIRNLLSQEVRPWALTKMTADDIAAQMAALLSCGIWHAHAPAPPEAGGGAVSEAVADEEDIAEIVRQPPVVVGGSLRRSAVAGGSTPIDAVAMPREKKIEGTPAPIDSDSNSIICMKGVLVVQNNNSGSDKDCTQAHENSHIADWKHRYGDDLCRGVPNGSLPVGGEGYDDFLKKSECKAYKVGKVCREKLLKSVAEHDKAEIQRAIDRDNSQIKHYCG